MPPAGWLSFDVHSGLTTSGSYWRWPLKPQLDDPAQARKALWQAICRSVEKHLIADVPVGLFLSGGLDSSLIAAACAEVGYKPTCLTIAIDDPDRDESPYAAMLCQRYGLPHWVEPMKGDVGRDFDPRLDSLFDEPFPVSAALSAAWVSSLASRRFKVMLSGEGGDELFGGYTWHRRWLDWYGPYGKSPSPWRRPTNTLRAALGRNHMPRDPLRGYAQLLGAFPQTITESFFDPQLLVRFPAAADPGGIYAAHDQPSLHGFDRLQWLDLNLFLPNCCLVKMDRTSMAYGLEVRVPFLDKTLATLVGTIPQTIRNPKGSLKGLIKNLAHERLPPELLRKKKQGFSTPVRKWFPKPMILKDMSQRQAQGNWWKGIFNKNAPNAAAKLSGQRLWRAWHIWRWVHQQNQTGPPDSANRLQQLPKRDGDHSTVNV